MKKPCTNKWITPLCLLSSVLLSPLASFAAGKFTWTGNSGDNLWTTPGNWSITDADADTGTMPVGRVSVLLGNATADRNVIYRGATETINGSAYSNWIASDIRLEQTTASTTNQLSLYNSLSTGAGLTLAASAGTTKLFLSNHELDGSGTTMAAVLTLGYSTGSQTLAVGTNGILDLGGKTENSNNTAAEIRYAAITLNGGQINLQNVLRAGTNTSALYNLTGPLNIQSGTLTFGTASSHSGSTYNTDLRLNVEGNLTMSGGRIANHDPSISRQIWLKGATNTITGGALDSRINFVMNRAGEQTLTSTIALNDVLLRANGDTTVSLGVAAAGQNIGKMEFAQESANKTLIYKLSSDLSLKTGSAMPSALTWTGQANATYGIDTNGHQLNLTSANTRWTPNRKDSTGTAKWSLTGQGEIAATAFNFHSTGVAVSVGAGTTLRATGGAPVSGDSATISILSSSSGGSIDASSRFLYDGGTGNEGQLQSNRAIGILEVTSGTLCITGDTDFDAAGGIIVQANATLDFGTRTVGASSYAIGLDGSLFGTISGAAHLLLNNASLQFDFQQVATAGDYKIFNTSLGGTIAEVSIVGLHTASLVKTGDIWSGFSDEGLFSFAFDQGNGILSVTAVPEPASIAFLTGLGIITITLIRLRRHPR